MRTALFLSLFVALGNMGLLVVVLYRVRSLMAAIDRIREAQVRQGVAIAGIGNDLSNVAADVRELMGMVTAPGSIPASEADAIAARFENDVAMLESAAATLKQIAAEHQSAGEGTGEPPVEEPPAEPPSQRRRS